MVGTQGQCGWHSLYYRWQKHFILYNNNTGYTESRRLWCSAVQNRLLEKLRASVIKLPHGITTELSKCTNNEPTGRCCEFSISCICTLLEVSIDLISCEGREVIKRKIGKSHTHIGTLMYMTGHYEPVDDCKHNKLIQISNIFPNDTNLTNENTAVVKEVFYRTYPVVPTQEWQKSLATSVTGSERTHPEPSVPTSNRPSTPRPAPRTVIAIWDNDTTVPPTTPTTPLNISNGCTGVVVDNVCVIGAVGVCMCVWV